MNLSEFSRTLAQKRKELDRLQRSKLPRVVGVVAANFYQDNFHEQGFRNGGKRPWPKTKRQLSGGKSAVDNYPALFSKNPVLAESICYTPSDYRVKVRSGLKYAPVHNWGGTVQPTVTPKMRKWAWAKHYEEAGADKKKDTLWKRLALTKKSKLNIRIPQRQFLGESRELNEQIQQKMDSEVRNILNKEE